MDVAKLPKTLQGQLLDYKAYLQMELGFGVNTVDSYMGDVTQFAEFAASEGKRSFSEVGADTLVLWVGEISHDTKSTTQSRKISALRSLASHLLDEKIWSKNLCDMVVRPKVRRNIPEILDAHEVDSLLAAPQKSDKLEAIRDKAMLELMYSSGLRVSELCALKSEDIDACERVLRVRGKGGKTRLVPVGDMALDAILKYSDIRAKLLKNHTAPELFVTRRGKKLSRKTFWYNIKKYALDAGIDKNVKPHILRHSFATHMLQNGANLMAIREMLGHSDLSTTQIYTNLVNDDIAREYSQKHPRANMKIDME